MSNVRTPNKSTCTRHLQGLLFTPLSKRLCISIAVSDLQTLQTYLCELCWRFPLCKIILLFLLNYNFNYNFLLLKIHFVHLFYCIKILFYQKH